MTQSVSCPECGHIFEVDDEFVRYEKIVAEIVVGKLAPERTAGYDVIGSDGKTYQVKHCKNREKNRQKNSTRAWRWRFNNPEFGADFLVLFGGINGTLVIFLLDHRVFVQHLPTESCNKDGSNMNYTFTASSSMNGWIWNYLVTPENFIRRRDELTRAQQLALDIGET